MGLECARLARPAWWLLACRGYDGPHDCGTYNSAAWETGFFVSQGGSWDTPYGAFFLSWYSGALLQHADRVLAAAASALNKRGRPRKALATKEVCLRRLMPVSESCPAANAGACHQEGADRLWPYNRGKNVCRIVEFSKSMATPCWCRP